MIFSIGHSNHSLEKFLSLLSEVGISAIVDVRSSPYSHFSPHFGRESLVRELRQRRIEYVFLGKELGARQLGADCIEDGKVSFSKVKMQPFFNEGIQRVVKGSKLYTIAIMCSEADPILCHRMILVCKSLRDEGFEISHILSDGRIETNNSAELRLLDFLKLPRGDLFRSEAEIIEEAYKIQSLRISFSIDSKSNEEE